MCQKCAKNLIQKMKTVSLKFTIRTDFKSSKGWMSVNLVCCTDGRRERFTLPVKVKPEFWDADKCCVRTKHPDSIHINKMLAFYKAQAETYKEKCVWGFQVFSIEGLKAALLGQQCSTDFIEFANQELTSDTTFSPNTIRSNRAKFNKFKGFIERMRKSPKMPISDISYDLITDYVRYMRSIGNNEGTVAKDLKVIKSFMNRAVKRDLLDNNLFQKLWGKLPIHEPEGNREGLTFDEFRQLERLHENKKLTIQQSNTLHLYLFECYTGLRYSDLRGLRWENIVNEEIRLQQQKTKRPVNIPLIEQAKKLLPEREEKLDADFVFRVYSIQVYNRYIKEIAGLAGIKRNISSHIGRHTCGSLLEQSGVPIEVTSKILGHTNIKTTMRYAKVSAQQKKDEMEKFSARLQRNQN
jgi:integrase